MKKLFTLIAAALMTIGASAAEQVDPGTTLTYGTPVSLSGNWDGRYIQLDGGNSDKSAFDYVWIKYSAVSGGDINFSIEYNEWLKDESWGPSYYSDALMIQGKSGVVGIAVEKTKTYTNGTAKTDGLYKGEIYAKHVRQVSIQDQGSAAQITVDGIFFGTEAEFKAAQAEAPVVYGDKEIALGTWGWGWSSTVEFADGIMTGTLTGDNGAISTGWSGADWSMYKYLVAVIESYSSTSDEPYLQILAKGASDDKKAAYQAISETFTEQRTIVMELDPSCSNDVRQFWFQGKTTGDVIKVSKVYLTNDKPAVDEGGEEAKATTLIDYPTKNDGITLGSSNCTYANVTIHNNNADAIPGIKFANSYKTDGAVNTNKVELSVEGGFKSGDVITIAGAFNNSDNTKKAAVDLFTLSGTTATVLFTTNQFINGKDKEADPVEQTYTLTADADKLYLGRNGNTATYVTLLKVTRGGTTGIQQTIAPAKVIENNVIYNLAGQRVNENYKGIVIKNGKKYIQK
jgi:hypothetical protein